MSFRRNCIPIAPALLALALLAVACKRETASGTSEPAGADVLTRTIGGRFSIAILTATSAPPAPLFGDARCRARVVRDAFPAEANLPLEAGLEASISQRGSAIGRASTGGDGRAALIDQPSGLVLLEVHPRDRAVEARVPIELESRRNDVTGAITKDSFDVDGDGDVAEWSITLDVLPDDDGDGASDTGRRARWVLVAGGGVALRHTGAGTSVRAVLDSTGAEVSTAVFQDRDGDFIPDEDDGDDDGDGVPDGQEQGSLACPGFRHEPLSTPGSEHAGIACTTCHRSETEAPLACEDCHTAAGRAYNDTPRTRPVGHFERGCEQCHVADRPWAEFPGDSGEKHAAFPLIGLHNQTDCFRCHVTGNRKPPKTCESCHLGDAGVDHYKSDCQACHSPAAWVPATLSHDHFPLTGGHQRVECKTCHTGPDYRGLSQECASCHRSDAPAKHDQPGFSNRACNDCHKITTWTDHTYQHSVWLLEGEHQTVACASCHPRATGYDGNQTVCEACHQAPAFPDHSDAMVFGTSCELCHSETGWVPARRENYDHSGFPLTGSHQTARCSSCHQNGTVLHPPRDCAGCHLSERPARHAGVFEGDCASCHKATLWTQLDPPYVHTQGFPLDGRHATTPCSSCHMTEYTAPTACVACHRADEPQNHYGDSCKDCHTTADWNPGGMSGHHSTDPTAFPLTGGHSGLLCSRCHTSGFTALPRACEHCHASDTPLGHATAGCARCHVDTTWTMATQPQRNAFHPLMGRHTLPTCVDCHGPYAAASGFMTPRPTTTCATCHPLPANHPLAVGAAACSDCHTINGWVPAQGGHSGPVPRTPFPYDTWSAAWFPHDRHHGATQCNKCHTRLGPGQPGYAFFSCTTACHRNQSGLNSHHNRGVDQGTEAKKRFHLYHFDPNAANTPPNEGGATWPTGHVGCVNRNCHPTGRAP